MKRSYLLIVVLFFFIHFSFAQLKDTLPYNRRDELLYRGKRYAVHNNYLLLGAGYNFSTLHQDPPLQTNYGLQFIFHIRRQHFHGGFLVSGKSFTWSRHIAFFGGYGYRKEDIDYNFGIFAGACYNLGIIPPQFTPTDTLPPILYERWGGYLSVHYIKKIFFDVGLGGEVFINVDPKHFMAGVKAVLFFSGAYRGKENRVNRYVKYRFKG
ncbi:MAG: hypothetical protein N3F09_07885 [Bacteroidia bacterium]|nr:hypothetical protein [Bacteroidia bacterium]